MESAVQLEFADIYDIWGTSLYSYWIVKIAVMIVAVAVFVGCYALYRWYKKRSKHTVRLSPRDKFARELSALQTLKNGDLKILYSQLTRGVKEYIEWRYHIKRHGLTDTEFIDYIVTLGTLPIDVVTLLKEIFNQATEIKFSDAHVGEYSLKAALESAVILFEKTKMEAK